VAIPMRGFGLTLGIGQEVTWGTAVARTNWLRLVSSTVERRILRDKIPHLGTYGAAATTNREFFDTAEESGGRIEWIPCYNDSTLMLLRHVFGVTPTDGGAGPFTHAYTLASPPPPGLTLEIIRGTHASLNPGQVFEGCKIDSFELTAEAGRPVMCAIEVIGETATGLQAAGTPTYSSAPLPILHNHLDAAVGVTFNATPQDARRLVLTIRRNLQRNMQLGTLFTAEPFENRIEVSLEIERLWNSAGPYSAHYAGTQGDVTFNFTSSPNIAAFTMHNAVIDEVSAPTQAADGLRQTVRWTGYADATDMGCNLLVTNANTLYSAN
jgi:hypothetical protein